MRLSLEEWNGKEFTEYLDAGQGTTKRYLKRSEISPVRVLAKV